MGWEKREMGMRDQGRWVFPDEASPRTQTFIINTIVNTPSEVVSQAEAISPGSEG
jgi:hypothetical protein